MDHKTEHDTQGEDMDSAVTRPMGARLNGNGADHGHTGLPYLIDVATLAEHLGLTERTNSPQGGRRRDPPLQVGELHPLRPGGDRGLAAGLPRRPPHSNDGRQLERDEAMRAEQQRSLRGRFDSVRREVLAGHDDALASVEVERRLELEARRGFAQAVAEARAAGHSWEQIVSHVPGLGPASGVDPAENLFELVSVPGSRFGEHHVTWRCGSCEGLVLDRGPEAGHPVDAEPGHRAHCERLATEVGRYAAAVEADDEIAADLAASVTDYVRELKTWDRPVEIEGPGLELW